MPTPDAFLVTGRHNARHQASASTHSPHPSRLSPHSFRRRLSDGVAVHGVTARAGDYTATVFADGQRLTSCVFTLTADRDGPLVAVVEPEDGVAVFRSAVRR